MYSPALRRTVGIPLTKSEISKPYEHLWNSILMRTGQIPQIEPSSSSTIKDESPAAKETNSQSSNKK